MNHGPKLLQRLGWEYDIRETPEDLYLAVLARRKAENDCSGGGLNDGSAKAEPPATDQKRPEMR
jgi:hypothetical protein